MDVNKNSYFPLLTAGMLVFLFILLSEIHKQVVPANIHDRVVETYESYIKDRDEREANNK